jgi:hypothetical protein
VLSGRNGDWGSVGRIERVPEFLADVHRSEAQLQEAVATGAFAIVDDGLFTRVDVFESADEWPEYLLRPKTAGFVGDDEAVGDALVRLDAGEESLRVEIVYRVTVCRARPV